MKRKLKLKLEIKSLGLRTCNMAVALTSFMIPTLCCLNVYCHELD